MSENKEEKMAKLEKVCLDHECHEIWEKHSGEVEMAAKNFVFCPYCSEELHIQCSACQEALSNKDYKYCPWCGAKFEE